MVRLFYLNQSDKNCFGYCFIDKYHYYTSYLSLIGVANISSTVSKLADTITTLLSEIIVKSISKQLTIL
jgi:hypothetical protein